ncbi:MAG: NAD(+) synthase [Lachnospiraceae bacterium]|nr:NAD(+) synthase [Lachnospiraceae bacterium]
MKDGFIKVAVSAPDLKVADAPYNVEKMIEKAKGLAGRGVKLLAFPELSLTGYTCNDLFLQDTLMQGAEQALFRYVQETEELPVVSVLGMPLEHRGRLYNTAVVVNRGKILGIVPKGHIPNYGEFYEARQFASGQNAAGLHEFSNGDVVEFGTRLLFKNQYMREFCFAIEICEDLWMPVPPSGYHAMAGANIIVNLSASDELTGKAAYRRELVKNQSARTLSAYLYADAGEGESTTDMVFAGHNMIVENGTILKESEPFSAALTEGGRAGDGIDLVTEIDLLRLKNERRRMTTFPVYETPEGNQEYRVLTFDIGKPEETELTRTYTRTPFVPETKTHREKRCNEILNIQAAGLAKRLRHTGCQSAVIGLSGGLDSTLALLVTARAFDRLGLDRAGITCVTMPCFGTTSRTYDNAVNLAKELGALLREIPIKEAVLQHFRDIGHDSQVQDITYENGQARERTQILMDVANQTGGLVIGTGDMSELALGWATYNGDHMSMYGVNCSVPKTLVRYLVQYYADTDSNKALRNILYDVLDTPVSPELLPPKEGEISQRTEDIVGPYELHDFFLYYMLRFGFTPGKLFRLAVYTFQEAYGEETIYKWLSTFCHRFFRQQFKRSCLPDGPKVGTVSVSPRGDLRMPSDASDALWKEELDRIRDSLV